jgi:hypothetical protein
MENRDNPKSNYFHFDDKPPIIEVFGERHERIQIMKLYLDAEGDSMEPNMDILNDPNISLEDIEALHGLTQPEKPAKKNKY